MKRTKERTTTLVLIVAALVFSIPALGEVDWDDSPLFTLDLLCPEDSDTGLVWDDSPLFTLDLLCQDPSDTGLVWDDSPLFTLDLLCQGPSDSGVAWGDSGVFVLQFADLDQDGDVDLHDFAVFARCFTGSGGFAPPGCECADLDGDLDIDMDDFTHCADNITGPDG